MFQYGGETVERSFEVLLVDMILSRPKEIQQGIPRMQMLANATPLRLKLNDQPDMVERLMHHNLTKILKYRKFSEG
jgi:hypothetical protein